MSDALGLLASLQPFVFAVILAAAVFGALLGHVLSVVIRYWSDDQ